jgi:ABC-type Na+ transport system ATPase subunit NatA
MNAIYDAERDEDFDGKELGELELFFKEYKEGLTVKELKELLVNEADDNIISIVTKNGTRKITRLVMPVLKDSSGKETVNDTGTSIRFVLNNEE